MRPGHRTSSQPCPGFQRQTARRVFHQRHTPQPCTHRNRPAACTSVTTESYPWTGELVPGSRRCRINVLFVCTAGSRSPIAAALFEKGALASRLANLRQLWRHHICGQPMPSIGLTRIAEHGVGLTGQPSVPVGAHAVSDADIVLGITREYVREIIAVSPDAWHKTFALTDLMHRPVQPCRGRRRRHQRVSDWLDSIGTGRDSQDGVRADPAEGVPNPFGQRARRWDPSSTRVTTLLAGRSRHSACKGGVAA
jgi:protein-tyrosine-phosphatase